MNLAKKCIAILFILIFLTGCLYPKERLKQNQIPYSDQLSAVQHAVNQFQIDNGGLLPIKNRDFNTPIYHKYPIDFNKLIPHYMQEPPGTAYESGGNYIYVLVDVETEPTVKLFDLKIADTIRELALRIDMHRSSNRYPPFNKAIADNVYSIDYKKLGYKEEPYAESPITGNNLPFIITNELDIYVDYRIDLNQALQNYQHPYKSGDDIRDILVDNSPFVPAYSLPYSYDENSNEPIFLAN